MLFNSTIVYTDYILKLEKSEKTPEQARNLKSTNPAFSPHTNYKAGAEKSYII